MPDRAASSAADPGPPTRRDAARAERSRALRADGRAARRSLVGHDRAERERALCERLLALPEVQRADSVGWYLPTDGEVDLWPAVDALRARGVELLLPVVGEDRAMHFAPWPRDGATATNRYGIAEPQGGPLLGAEHLDVVVVPCVAVDARCHRLGFGAGYYDRALGAAPRAIPVGVAFEVQVVADIAPEPWDVVLHAVVTEARVLRPDAGDPG